jgi:hypothetical protein
MAKPSLFATYIIYIDGNLHRVQPQAWKAECLACSVLQLKMLCDIIYRQLPRWTCWTKLAYEDNEQCNGRVVEEVLIH